MRPLTEEETRVMFEKIAKYEKILKLAANISGDKLVSLGTCFGKFTKTHRFRLHVTALDYLAPYAKYKVWIKPGAEQSFLYGNHVLKSGLGRITENTCQYQGVVVYSMADVPLMHPPRRSWLPGESTETETLGAGSQIDNRFTTAGERNWDYFTRRWKKKPKEGWLNSGLHQNHAEDEASLVFFHCLTLTPIIVPLVSFCAHLLENKLFHFHRKVQEVGTTQTKLNVTTFYYYFFLITKVIHSL
ncbi:60S ribosome subunit biogenesis protein NIP7 homolog isoform X2 [Lontra canadensis]|uniref:60S ribosome subunit biogenesis protein NIP7 homolog isoform X2 n=1 Tax=Lontra canadensis TaxID=76717 RepID=UPI0013F35B05|nr:60S ribosome subunit biogenesis protein NIP7 homolog isoform X2 [Lontra canadensis]